MRKMISLPFALLALVFAHAECRAQTAADQLNQLTQSRSYMTHHAWQAEDKCNQNAWGQYPDYTKEANEKRERAFRLCQMSGHLPPRAPLVAPPVPSLDAHPAH